MNIVLATDGNMLPGLHVSIYSFLKNVNKRCHIYVVYDNISADEITEIADTIRLAGRGDAFHPLPFEDLAVPYTTASIHGSRLCFSLIALPEYLDVERLIWLDCDLIVSANLSELWKTSFTQPIAAVSHTVTRHTLPKWRNALHDAGIASSYPHFNTGVCIINVDEWRRRRVTERAFAFGEKYQIGGDQPLLNMAAEFHQLPAQWNRPCYRNGRAPNLLEPGVWHMVGSPKPWDVGGRLHKSYAAYAHIQQYTAFQPRHSLGRFIRSGRLSRSYLSLLKERWKSWRDNE